MQSPSFLAHQRALAERRGRSNAHILLRLDRILCDNQIRQLLDGVSPEHFDDLFHDIIEDLRTRGGLEPMRRRDGRALIALDGTQYFHQMLGATLVAPGHAQTLPLPPAFIRPQDGAGKQDCERQAVKRWLRRHGPRCAERRPVYLGDDLYACQPVCQAILASGGDFLLTGKPDSHKTRYEFIDGIDLPTRRTRSGRGSRQHVTTTAG